MQVKPLKILSASAGSGKTFALASHYLALTLMHPQRYRSILALTFTNKATAEMKSRILKVLKNLALGQKDGATLAYLKEIQKNFPNWDEEEIFKRAQQSYRYIIHDLSRFNVQTIDGFLQQVIRSFTYELDLDSGYRIELNANKVKQDLSQRLFDILSDDSDLKKWTLDQMLNNLDSDINWDIEAQLNKLSGLIFNESFKDFDDKISRPENADVFKDLWKNANEFVKAFEDYYKVILQKIKDSYQDIVFVSDDFFRGKTSSLYKFLSSDVLNADIEFVKTVLSQFMGEIDNFQRPKKREAHIETLYYRINPLFEELHAFLESQEQTYQISRLLKDKSRYLRLVKKMSDLLADWRMDERAQLLSDAQLLLDKIGLNQEGELTFIWEKLGNQFQYFLFDEFQDTSKGQWQSLLPLLVNALGQGETYLHPHHLIVGDVKQSIYRFRNGDFRILLQGVEKDIKKAFHLESPDAFIMKQALEFNYRSSKTLVEFNNALYAKIPQLLQEYLNDFAEKSFTNEEYEAFWLGNSYQDILNRAYQDQFQKIPPHKTIDKGEVKIYAIPKVKNNQNGEIEEDLLLVKAYETLKNWVYEDKINPGNIAVLVDTANHSRSLYDFIIRKAAEENINLPVSSGDGLLLEHHEAIKCLINILKSFAYPGKSYAIYFAYAVYHYHAYKGTALQAETWMSLSDPELGRKNSGLPINVIESWPQYNRMPLGILIEKLIHDLEFDKDPSLLPYLVGFRDFIEKFNGFGHVGIPRFLKFWEDEKEKLTLPDQGLANSIQILTIHKSKGLEYEAVLIPFVNWSLSPKHSTQVWMELDNTPFLHLGSLPFTFSEVKKTHKHSAILEETLLHVLDKLNQLYVATTRAVDKLTLFIEEKDLDVHSDKSQQIGKYLFKSLEASEADSETEDSHLVYHVSSKQESLSLSEEVNNELDIRLDQYNLGEVLGDMIQTRTPTDSDLQWHLSLEGRRFGNILHEIMSLSSQESDSYALLDKQISQGKVPENKRVWLHKLLSQVWNHPVLGPYLSHPHPQINELGIIDEQGKMVRPDKVILLKNKTLVIDFKISDTNRSEEYKHQLQAYIHFLKSMGYPQVEGYLYYFIQNEAYSIQ